MGLSTLLNFGIGLYEAYDDGMFDGFLNSMPNGGYPTLYNMFDQGSRYQMPYSPYGYTRTYATFGYY
ncbi:unnamed protein product [Rotaria sp. Silwood2]|nr:unnamed protein product [Rotaria sp. Silwood2]CAF2533437.1 unnamed protein product [Rotaria sp. Silwood2]CAF2785957.1 unnamed protein product [Rotaria sp. Silwood2]CAF2930535.1 unnamed protein product [Rotaria sp. Silwood2]CAF4002854.1 unnamed protein product [Rotaria sp. Silwood2]